MTLFNFNECKAILFSVMGIKGRRVHMIEEMSDTVISFQKGESNCVFASQAYPFALAALMISNIDSSNND